jgi:hypothetical protein
MMYLLVSQHVSGIIMPIIRRTVQSRQRLWCTALAMLQQTRGEEVVRCALVGIGFSHETNPNKCTMNHLFSSSLQKHGQRCTPQALSALYCSPDDGHDDAQNMLIHQ